MKIGGKKKSLLKCPNTSIGSFYEIKIENKGKLILRKTLILVHNEQDNQTYEQPQAQDVSWKYRNTNGN